jgi:hypothetical protein
MYLLVPLFRLDKPWKSYTIGTSKSAEKESENMRSIRAALIVAVISCFGAGAAFADDINVVFDPVPIVGSFGIISDPTAVYTVSWVSCSSNGIPSDFAGDTACIALVNETNTSLMNLILSFTVNSALVGQTISCSSLDGYLSSNTCPSVPGPFTLGQIVTVEFFAGSPIQNLSTFFFGETGVDLADAPVLTVYTPEPASFTLLAAGLGLIGFCTLFVKRFQN